MRLERVLVRVVAAAVLVSGFSADTAEAAADSRAPARRELRRRRLTIDDQTLGSLPELHVAGGSATILTFEIPVRENGALITDTRGLFHPPTQTDKTVILVPKADLAQPAALSVTLSDGTVLSFKLLSVPKEADVQVDVILALQSRASPDSAQALKTTIEQLRGELDECQASSATAGAAKLASLLLGQNLEEPQTFDRHALRGGDKQNRLLVEARWIYRLVGLTYLVFTVENRDPSKGWMFDRAEVKLTGAGEAVDLRVLAASAEVPILAPGQGGMVVVAFKTPGQTAAHRYTVSFLEKDGGRRVVLEGLSP
jgi:uncharacterized protein (TIGR02268 family)